MANLPQLILKSGKERSLERFHPWLFSGAIKETKGSPSEGDLVEIRSNQGEFLALGHYQKSSLAVRILSFKETPVDADFWTSRVRNAIEVRKATGLWNDSSTNVFRLIHGEGDNLPGLIADWYNGVIVMQCHSAGMFLSREAIASAFKEAIGEPLKAIYDKSEGTLPFKSGIQQNNAFLFGESGPVEVLENGNRYRIDFIEGQKTGFFIDQRDNRILLGEYSKGKNVLNTFCYSGAFSVAALKAGARRVVSVDSSEKAIQLTKSNISLNNYEDKHESVTADVMRYLADMEEIFDVIVLDPPAYAKHQDVLENALKGYTRLNKRAFEKIAPGGILFTFSCSQVVSKDDFRKAVFSAAAQSSRSVRILHQLHQPADHPINIYHPEGEYLKGLVLHVT